MTQNQNLADLSAAGVSVWLDDLSRERLQTGNLQSLIDTKSVVGVTTNPSIFQAALSKGDAYDDQIAELAERGRHLGNDGFGRIELVELERELDRSLPVSRRIQGIPHSDTY